MYLRVEYGSQDMQNYKESNYEESESDIIFHISAGRIYNFYSSIRYELVVIRGGSHVWGSGQRHLTARQWKRNSLIIPNLNIQTENSLKYKIKLYTYCSVNRDCFVFLPFDEKEFRENHF